jgi:hypothetical protein
MFCATPPPSKARDNRSLQASTVRNASWFNAISRPALA